MSNTTVNGFVGPYAAVNWIQQAFKANQSEAYNQDTGCSINAEQIVLNMNDPATLPKVQVLFKAVSAGTISFNWLAQANTSCPGGYFVNNVGTQLYNGSIGATSGQTSFAVNKGDVFGFYYGFANPPATTSGTLTISNFSGPAYNGQSYILPKAISTYHFLAGCNHVNSSSWLPDSNKHGLFYLGNMYMGTGSDNNSPTFPGIVVQAFDNSNDESCLALPQKWAWIAAEGDVNMWRAVAPVGYIAIGPVWTSNIKANFPILPNYRCIRQDLVTLINSQTLTLQGSTGAIGGNHNIGFYSLPSSGYMVASFGPKNEQLNNPSPLYDIKI